MLYRYILSGLLGYFLAFLSILTYINLDKVTSLRKNRDKPIKRSFQVKMTVASEERDYPWYEADNFAVAGFIEGFTRELLFEEFDQASDACLKMPLCQVNATLFIFESRF